MGILGAIRSALSAAAGSIREERRKSEERKRAIEDAIDAEKARIIAAEEAEKELERKRQQDKDMKKLLGIPPQAAEESKKKVESASAAAESEISSGTESASSVASEAAAKVESSAEAAKEAAGFSGSRRKKLNPGFGSMGELVGEIVESFKQEQEEAKGKGKSKGKRKSKGAGKSEFEAISGTKIKEEGSGEWESLKDYAEKKVKGSESVERAREAASKAKWKEAPKMSSEPVMTKSGVTIAYGLFNLLSGIKKSIKKSGANARMAVDEAKPVLTLTTHDKNKIKVYGMKSGDKKVYIFGDPSQFIEVSSPNSSAKMYISASVYESLLEEGRSKSEILKILSDERFRVSPSEAKPGDKRLHADSIISAMQDKKVLPNTIAEVGKYIESGEAEKAAKKKRGLMGFIADQMGSAAYSVRKAASKHQQQYDNRDKDVVHITEPRRERKKVIPNLIVAATGTIQSIGNDYIIEKEGGKDYYVNVRRNILRSGLSVHQARKSITPKREPVTIASTMPGLESALPRRDIMQTESMQSMIAPAFMGPHYRQTARNAWSPFSGSTIYSLRSAELASMYGVIKGKEWSSGKWAGTKPSRSEWGSVEFGRFSIPSSMWMPVWGMSHSRLSRQSYGFTARKQVGPRQTTIRRRVA